VLWLSRRVVRAGAVELTADRAATGRVVRPLRAGRSTALALRVSRLHGPVGLGLAYTRVTLSSWRSQNLSPELADGACEIMQKGGGNRALLVSWPDWVVGGISQPGRRARCSTTRLW